MAIEVKFQKEAKKIDWAVILTYFIIAILIISIAGFFVMSYYKKKIEREIKNIEQKLAKNPQEDALEKEVLSLKKVIEDWAMLADAHVKTSNLFSRLEESTHPRVWFSKFELDTTQKLVDLEGKADNFEVLEQQMMILRGQKFVQDAELSNISFDREGGVNFSLQLVLDPSVFK